MNLLYIMIYWGEDIKIFISMLRYRWLHLRLDFRNAPDIMKNFYKFFWIMCINKKILATIIIRWQKSNLMCGFCHLFFWFCVRANIWLCCDALRQNFWKSFLKIHWKKISHFVWDGQFFAHDILVTQKQFKQRYRVIT